MCMIRTFFLCLAVSQINSVLANPQKTDLKNDEPGFVSFKEIGQALDEQMNILSEFFEHGNQASLGFVQNQAFKQNTIDAEVAANHVKIAVSVPNVENSEDIKAHVNAARNALKVIVPQRDRVTKIVITNNNDQTSIKQVTKQRSEQKHEGKNLHSFQMSSRKQVTYKTLPFLVDLSERSVEYKDNDMLIITVRKSPTSTVKKAQPRVINVTNK